MNHYILLFTFLPHQGEGRSPLNPDEYVTSYREAAGEYDNDWIRMLTHWGLVDFIEIFDKQFSH